MGLGSTNVCGAQHPAFKLVASTALETGHVIKAGPGIVVMLKGYNSGPDQFVQIHDKATAAADGDVPVSFQKVASGDNFSFLIPVCGLPPTANGIYVCNSSTGATRTVGAADCWFEVFII